MLHHAANARPSRLTYLSPPMRTPVAAVALISAVLLAGGCETAPAPAPAKPAAPPIVTMEDIVSRNPEVILVGPPVVPMLRESKQWQVVPAVKARKVFAYDTNVVGRPSVTLGMAAVNLASLLHPGVVSR